jgi:hypothetical protein
MNDEAELILKKTPLFASLSDKELLALAGPASKKRFQKGQLLLAEGDPCTGLYLVASGKIRIFELSASGREQVLAVEGPRSSFLSRAASNRTPLRIPFRIRLQRIKRNHAKQLDGHERLTGGKS